MNKNYYLQLIRTNLRLAWTPFLVLILMSSFGISTTKAQVSAYVFSQSTGSYTSISGGTVLGVATANSGAVTSLDSTSFPITIPFSFIFNGLPYTEFNMSTNGYIAFGPVVASGSGPISASTSYDGAISAWGKDINAVFDIAGKTGNMSWTIEGTAPNRVAVMQWENFRPSYTSSTTAAYAFSFQIRLAETTGVISTVYSTGGYLIGSSTYSGTNTQIGLRGLTNTDFNNRLNPSTVAFDSSTAGTANSNSQSFNTSIATPGMPADGLTYTWTPPTCLGPNTLSVSNITTTTADLAWNASVSAPANGYDVYYSTSNIPPINTTTPNFTGITGLTQSLSGLNPSSVYFVWVRSVCSTTDASNWVALPSFATTCAPSTYMYENFDSYAAGSIVPICWDRIPGTGTQTISTGTPNSPPNNIYQYSTTPANKTIVVLPVFSNINAGTHWLRLKARVTTAPRTIEFGYVTDATDANSFVLIEAKSITNTAYTSADSEYTIVVPTTVPANARLAIKNPGTVSTTLYYDDVYWEPAPTCFPPANVTTASTTATSADITWTASTPVPALGYDVYYSTVNVAPIASTAPNITGITLNSVTLTGLTPSTQYYAWVRAKCSASDNSIWSAKASAYTLCQPPAITGTTTSTSPTPMCKNDTATLTATADAGATINWYAAPSGGTVVGTGSPFTTPALTASTNYYVSASTGIQQTTGVVNALSTSGYTLEAGLFFDATSSFVIEGVNVYPIGTGAGTVEIALQDGNVTPAVTLQTITVNLTGTPAPYVKTYVPLNFTVLPGTNYKLMMMTRGGLVSSLVRESGSSWGTYPIVAPGMMSITNGNCCSGNTVSTSYYYFYDWQISSKCESARTAVAVDVNSACDILGTSEVEARDNVKLYPNPFTDIINISDVKGLISISVTDLSGRIVKTILNPSAQVHLGELNAGMYLLTLKYKDGKVKTVKAIKK